MEPSTVIDTTQLAGSATAADFSLWALLLTTDWITRGVLALLLAASIWSWAIIFDKLIALAAVRRKADAFEKAFWSGKSLEDLYDRVSTGPRHPMIAVFLAGMREWRRSVNQRVVKGDALIRRLDVVMEIAIGREMARLERRVPFLASLAAAAPLLGLFGTVWGIINSFEAIAAQQNTNLAVVAPGMAEALFTTALGIIAAIPAMLAYNRIASDLGGVAARMEAFAGEFSAIVSRQLDERSGQ